MMASSGKKLKLENSAMEIDRLSALPDPLIFQIVDRLGLEEAAKTSVLSKQWRYMWTNVPFAFREHSKDMEDRHKFVARVNAAIAHRRGPALHDLLVIFHFHNRFTPDVNSWLDFAAKKGVKDLYLSLNSSDRQHKYPLPQIIYSNSSLETLGLTNCIAPPPTRLEWPFLKHLTLKFVDLPQQVIGEIVSGCPVLNYLSLSYCVGFNRLEMGGRSLRWLSVSNCGGERELEISAPYARYLQIGVSCVETRRRRTTVRLQNVQYVESASIDVYAFSFLSIPMKMNRRMRNTTTPLLQQLGHIKTLKLSGHCTQVVSCMATNGCEFPQLSVEDLHMEVESYVQSIYGVVAMLESSPNLHTLRITGLKPLFGKVSMLPGPITRDDLNCDLLHLKTVELDNFFSSDNSGEPTLTLAQILLKRGPVLEKMTVYKMLSGVDTTIDSIKKTLLDHPKSSTEVSVEFSTY